MCRIYEIRKEALKSNDIIFVKKVLEEFSDLWVNSDFDNCYYKSLIDGSWPDSEEILTKILNSIKGKNDERNHRTE